ncbi:MAG: KGG domain-containing protein [Patescibacteria group bacterium]
MANNNGGNNNGGNDKNNRGGNQGNSSNRGFASMDSDRQREIASEGGRVAHERGTAHEWDSEEARRAGQKGGQQRSQNSSNSGDMNDSMGEDSRR